MERLGRRHSRRRNHRLSALRSADPRSPAEARAPPPLVPLPLNRERGRRVHAVPVGPAADRNRAALGAVRAVDLAAAPDAVDLAEPRRPVPAPAAPSSG